MLDAREVLAKVDIVDVIRHYIPIQARGKALKAVCPFHDDHEPSLSISREKQLFKCFSCGTSGNAISFVQKYENIPFKEALEKVAVEFAHMEVTKVQHKSKFSEQELRLFKVHREANAYANYNLRTAEGQEALKYLNDRHLTPDQIDHHMIGYVSDDAKLHHFLQKKGFSDQELRSAGLFDEKDRYLFSQRLTFPVKNPDGYYCGCTSRRIKEDGSGKYINSKESPIFQKNALLYHLPEAIKQTRSLILVEGTLDVVGLERVGVNQGIASLGTALTKAHVELLKRLHCSVTLCYDGDPPGRKATVNSYHMLRDVGITPKIIILNDGMDPDELSLKDPTKLEVCLNEDNNIFDFYLKTMPSFDTFSQKKEFILNYMKDLSLSDLLTQEEYLSRLGDKVDLDVNILRKQLQMMQPPGNTKHNAYRSSQEKQSTPSHKQDKVLINQQVKEKMELRKEVTKNFDRLREKNLVIAFDHDKVMQRSDILEKYLYLRGPVMETQFTLLGDKDHADFYAQAVCEDAVKVICEDNEIAKANINYIAYLHKDTKYPHVHLQVWQKEPFLARYKVDNQFFQHLKTKINEVMEKPIDLNANPLIAQHPDMDESITEAITIN